MRLHSCGLLSITLGCTAGPVEAVPKTESLPPLQPRPETSTCRMLGTPAWALGRPLVEVVESAEFDRPVQLLAHADGLAVAEAGGRVWRLDGAGNRESEPWLDISDRVALDQRGLLSIALDQSWMYVHYQLASDPTRSRLIRLANEATLNPSSELTMIELQHASEHAIGGALAIEAEGVLWVGVGDGVPTAPSDPYASEAQNLGSLAGSILRLRVPEDPSVPGYEIPSDNPWPNSPGVRPEIFAHGVHDPRSLVTNGSNLWVFDRGSGLADEFSRVQAGVNLGWPITEGWTCTGPGDCDATAYVGPSFDYQPDETHCEMVGGAWVGGDEVPGLAGAALWADRCSGRIWGFDPTPIHAGVPAAEVLEKHEFGVAAIGSDSVGNVWLIDSEGRLARLRHHPDGVPGTLPTHLDATGCFVGNHQPEAALVPYLVSSPLWSDGLTKQRWMVVPPGLHIDIAESGEWAFPDGSVVIKQFNWEDKPVETRFMVRRSEVWDFYTYRWRDDGSNADLLEGADSLQLESLEGAFSWSFPSSNDCRSCHGFGDSEALGLDVLQINRLVAYGDVELEQLDALAAIDMFSSPPGEAAELPRLVDPADTLAPLDLRARSYLHANCGHCHQPRWMEPDLRFGTAWAEMGLCGHPTEFPAPGIAGDRRLAPGAPEDSNAWQRMRTRAMGGMPPIGSGRLDELGIDLIEAWILSIESCPE